MACTQSTTITYNPSTKALLSNAGGAVKIYPHSVKAEFSAAAFGEELCREGEGGGDKTFFLFHDKPVCMDGPCYCGSVRLKTLEWDAGCTISGEIDNVFRGTLTLTWNATLAEWELILSTGCSPTLGWIMFYARSTDDPRCVPITWTNEITSATWSSPANASITVASGDLISNWDSGTPMDIDTSPCCDICVDHVWECCYAAVSTVTVDGATWTYGGAAGGAQEAVYNVLMAAKTLDFVEVVAGAELRACDCIPTVDSPPEYASATWQKDFVETVAGTPHTVTVTATRLWKGSTSYWAVSYSIGASNYITLFIHCDGLGTCCEAASVDCDTGGSTGTGFGNAIEGCDAPNLTINGAGTLSITVNNNTDAGCKDVTENDEEYFPGSCKGCQEGANWP